MSSGPKGIAKRAVNDTAKAAIGVDQEELDRKARIAPDMNHRIKNNLDVVETGKSSKKKL